MVFFPNYELEIFHYTDSTEKDAYGNPKQAYVYSTTVPCDFQSMTPKDSLTEFGKILEDTYKIIIPEDTIIHDTSVLRLKGYSDVYNITGTPIRNNRFKITSHIKVIVQKTRKPIILLNVPEEQSGEVEP